MGLLVLLMLLIGILYFFSTYPVVTFILLGLFVLAVCLWIWLLWRVRHLAMLRLQAVEAQRLRRDTHYIPADVLRQFGNAAGEDVSSVAPPHFWSSITLFPSREVGRPLLIISNSSAKCATGKKRAIFDPIDPSPLCWEVIPQAFSSPSKRGRVIASTKLHKIPSTDAGDR